MSGAHRGDEVEVVVVVDGERQARKDRSMTWQWSTPAHDLSRAIRPSIRGCRHT